MASLEDRVMGTSTAYKAVRRTLNHGHSCAMCPSAKFPTYVYDEFPTESDNNYCFGLPAWPWWRLSHQCIWRSTS